MIKKMIQNVKNLRDEMKPLYDWLATQNEPIFTETDLKFLKGTVTTDGRLDLCKQVIGPEGIAPLLTAMANHKSIDRLLLGNNIVGDQGAKLIGEFIQSGSSPLTVWYIAGNNITHEGIKHVCQALLQDNQVTGLWLKRNPLKAEGMLHLSHLIRFNQNIQVLDLINCGLLDDGVKNLMQGLCSGNTSSFSSNSRNTGLRHLYLSANGISPVGLQYMDPFFASGQSFLETLFLGCNRIGNEGAKIIGQMLKHDKKLVRLNIASSRIGAEGMKHLSESLRGHPNLMVLDMGYMRSTIDLGELGNCVGDGGIVFLGDLIRNSRLISLNITHNHLSSFGLEQLKKAVGESKYLAFLDYVQFGVTVDQVLANDLKEKLAKNKEFLENEARLDFNSILVPDHVQKIYSVYRTH